MLKLLILAIIYHEETLHMPTYSFRAECTVDVDHFLQALTALGISATIQRVPDCQFPDVDVQLETLAPLDVIRNVMRKIEDSHVMCQTLRACPLAENTLQRDYSQ